ncbi:MAG TPA: iron chelate uptake ABC transporter family permease subunit [Actinomycetota bacterium]|nr:iron chelate uptake ABC transporter family permease subunit [Actinomycetota bacterium]
MTTRRGAIAVLAVLLVVAVLLALGLGTVWIPPRTILRLMAWKAGLAGAPADVPPSTAVILFELRLPRVLLAVVVGAALGTAGAIFQALFRNPMADPAILGVSSGAALGAVAAILLGGGVLAGGLMVPAAGFVGALAVAFLVYRLGRIGPAVQVGTLLLAGIAVAAVISAIISLVLSFSGEQIRSIYFWLLGGLGGRGWDDLTGIVPLVVVGIVLALVEIRDLNAMALGEERAAQLGVEIERFKRLALATGALLAAAAVSVAGVIGFVGLMTPHILRLVLGADHRRLLPATILGGAVFMVLADLAARSLVPPEEIPVGAVTALLGGPFFLYLLRHERKAAGERA